MSIIDDEWQRMAEEGKAVGSEDRDAMAYQRLFAILRERPEAATPTGFENLIIQKIERARKRSRALDHIGLITGLGLLVIIGAVATAASGLRIPLSGWQWNIMMLGICAGIVITVLNTIERKLLKRR
jgi:hypothetical protein